MDFWASLIRRLKALLGDQSVHSSVLIFEIHFEKEIVVEKNYFFRMKIAVNILVLTICVKKVLNNLKNSI